MPIAISAESTSVAAVFTAIITLLGLAFIAGSLAAMGVGKRALTELMLALFVMTAVAVLIAVPFLRKKTAAELPPSGDAEAEAERVE